MKKLIIGFCLFWLCCFDSDAFGQTEAVNEGYWRNGGRMLLLRNGQLIPLKEPVVLSGGVTLFSNGAVLTREGVRRYLQEGQAIDASGRILFPQVLPDGSVILVPRKNYIIDRDPGLSKDRKAGPPLGRTQGYYRSRFR